MDILSPSVLVPEQADTRGAALQAALRSDPSVICISRTKVSEFSYRKFFVSFGKAATTSVVDSASRCRMQHFVRCRMELMA